MIDTVVLLIDYPNFNVVEPELFYPHASKVLNLDRYSRQAIQRPSKQESQAGVYKPRLTLRKRPMEGAGVSIYLLVEFSIPKLIFGNNFDEINENDFNAVIQDLQLHLLLMGVIVSKEILTLAKVISIHYGKNYVLTDYTTPYTYIEEISKAGISKIFDVNRTDFRNEGHSWKFRSNTFEFTLYDKVKDLEKSKISIKRSIEPDPSKQHNVLSNTQKIRCNQPFEVLRLEIRLNGTRKIKQELKSLKLSTNLTFQSLFSKKISKTICLKHLEKIRENLLLISHRDETPFIDHLQRLLELNPNKKPSVIFAYATFNEIATKNGVRVARQYLDPRNSGSWYYQKKQFADIIKPTTSKRKIDDLIQRTKDFKTERLNDYSQFM